MKKIFNRVSKPLTKDIIIFSSIWVGAAGIFIWTANTIGNAYWGGIHWNELLAYMSFAVYLYPLSLPLFLWQRKSHKSVIVQSFILLLLYPLTIVSFMVIVLLFNFFF